MVLPEYFQFSTMISTSIIRGLHLLGFIGITAGSVFWWVGSSSGKEAILSFLLLTFGNLLWRLICEAWILFFRIHESLVSIEHNTYGGQDTDESWVNCAIQDCSNKVSLGKSTKYCAIHIE